MFSKVEIVIEVVNVVFIDLLVLSSYKNVFIDILFLFYLFLLFEKESGFNKIFIFLCGLDDCGLRENRMYLVVGGICGYGFEVVCWMVENGV